ncbi:MAG TPA: beta-ketoacyl-[acyl-carrier-protein] synthase family protein [Roseimicrobium sp.]|nr:beta-ketoacyl-[acyl-carrier-protein] synthase family protein [Roseimicrobium sp.]
MLYPKPRNANSPVRVVVTGAGIATAQGMGWKTNAAGFRLGRTAFKSVTVFDAGRQRTHMAAEADIPETLPTSKLSTSRQCRMERAGKLLLLAGLEAWQQSGWEAGDNIPLIFGTTSGGMVLGEDYYRDAINHHQQRRHQPTRVTHYQAQQQIIDLADAVGISGPIQIIANACASGANAIGHAYEQIRSGRSKRAITGGFDGISQLVFAGFDSLQALSTTTCRPFDQHRDGLALGEGAAVLTLESLDDALARNATILGEIVGYGAATDVHHLTQPHPAGAAALASMQSACAQAGVRPDQIDYINAHGTGTPLNDSAEAAAINSWAGDVVANVKVSSTKAGIGHLLGAAGAVEAVICLMTLREQWLPPMPGLLTPDAACKFSLVRQPIDARVDYALTNSFGFGGANATLVLRRWS